MKYVLEHFGIDPSAPCPAACSGANTWHNGNKSLTFTSLNPSTTKQLGLVAPATKFEYDAVVSDSLHALKAWKVVPAPARGLFIRELGERLRVEKEALAVLISLEMGKIISEARGEVQEMIDMCDFAVGLSRQLYGLTMHSERQNHRMYEQWHPLGVVGIITAFNFPVAVWAWNAILALVCGNTTIWKPSPLTPLCAHAVHKICLDVAKRHNCEGIFSLVHGGTEQGEWLAADENVSLVSATGSTAMGKKVAGVVGMRLGRTLLELGGNNALIVDKTASLDLAVRAILFAAIGTTGQRCTSLRRLLVHKSLKPLLLERLVAAYRQIKIGDPQVETTLMGPLISDSAVAAMNSAMLSAKEQGGKVIFNGGTIPDVGFFVAPSILEMPCTSLILQQETFAPLLFVITFNSIDEAIHLQNNVRQGLSSALFTESLSNSEYFLSAQGSDCGIANINIGTSGAEIGGAFGGEKDTGGGREAGSDAWKNYMRRQTTTINWSNELPLAQGITFG
jgi:aldehyde dehydrogenase (NAD+)